MTVEEIKSRIEKIKESAGDDEAAHSLEDDLYQEFIDYISKLEVLNGEDLQDKAALILTIADLDFGRWCA